jgi:hypothetical protein
MTEQSKFSKLPKNQLVFICERIIDDGFESQLGPYRDYEDNFDSLKNTAEHFSFDVEDIDVQFFCKFLEINDDILADIFDKKSESVNYNKELLNKLIIPIAKTYEVDYRTYGTCHFEEYLYSKFTSYDEDWVMDSAQQSLNDGNWDYYEGTERREPEYSEFNIDDVVFDGVREVSDDNIKESLLDRLVIENTSEVVSSLDKQTLLKLKRIIESRLLSL